MTNLPLGNLDLLTDECFSFVTDPKPARGSRGAIESLRDSAPQVVEVLEAMVIDGVDERAQVADYLRYVFGA
jgi:hypothetical protein